MANQRGASRSRFQETANKPIETVLFNDIIEEKRTQLSEIMCQYWRVNYFNIFETEFNSFIKRLKHITSDGYSTGANPARRVMYIPSDNEARPLNKPTEEGGSQVNNQQQAAPSNVFKQPSVPNYKPRTTLTLNNQSNNIRNKAINLCDTIIEEILTNDDTQKNIQHPECLPPTASVLSSGSSQTDKASFTTISNGNDDDTMESNSDLVESVQILKNSDNTTTSRLNQSQSNCSARSKKNIQVKYLTKWSVNLEPIKSNKGNSKSVITLTGTLLARNQTTILKVHRAGIVVARITNRIVKTDNGLYHLIGPITDGSPINLYCECVKVNGIPKKWKDFVDKLSTEIEVNLDESLTGQGTFFKENVVDHNPSETKSLVRSDLFKDSAFCQQLAKTSTSRKIKPFEVCPTQILKNRFHQKFTKACFIVSSQNNTD